MWQSINNDFYCVNIGFQRLSTHQGKYSHFFFFLDILNLNIQISCLLHRDSVLFQYKICLLFLQTRPSGSPRDNLMIYIYIDPTKNVSYSQMSLRQNKIGMFVESHALLIVTPNQINLFSRKTYLERSWCLLLNHSVASKWSAILNPNNLVMSHNQVTDPVHSIVSKLILQDSKMATSKQTFLLSVKYWPRQNKIQLKILSHLRKVVLRRLCWRQ